MEAAGSRWESMRARRLRRMRAMALQMADAQHYIADDAPAPPDDDSDDVAAPLLSATQGEGLDT